VNGSGEKLEIDSILWALYDTIASEALRGGRPTAPTRWTDSNKQHVRVPHSAPCPAHVCRPTWPAAPPTFSPTPYAHHARVHGAGFRAAQPGAELREPALAYDIAY